MKRAASTDGQFSVLGLDGRLLTRFDVQNKTTTTRKMSKKAITIYRLVVVMQSCTNDT